MVRGLSGTPSPYVGSTQSFVPQGTQEVSIPGQYSISDPGTVPPSAEASVGDRSKISADIKDEKQGSTLGMWGSVYGAERPFSGLHVCKVLSTENML